MNWYETGAYFGHRKKTAKNAPQGISGRFMTLNRFTIKGPLYEQQEF